MVLDRLSGPKAVTPILRNLTLQEGDDDAISSLAGRAAQRVHRSKKSPSQQPLSPSSSQAPESQTLSHEEEEEVEGDYESEDNEVIVPWGAPLTPLLRMAAEAEVEGVYSEDEVFQGQTLSQTAAST